MALLLRWLEKHRELVSYGFWGILTTVVNYAVYFLCTKLLGVNYLFSNILSWLLAVAFAFVTNKKYVFHSGDWSTPVVVKEAGEFVSGRLFSLLVETVLLYLFVDRWGFRDDVTKVATNLIVIVLNFFFAKAIFRWRKNGS